MEVGATIVAMMRRSLEARTAKHDASMPRPHDRSYTSSDGHRCRADADGLPQHALTRLGYLALAVRHSPIISARLVLERRRLALVELWFHNVVMAGTQAIDRAAQLLVRVVESARPLGVGELAEATELPKSTTSRLLAALERQGLLQRDGDRGPVRPGPVLLRFAQRTEPDVTLVDLADDHLDALARDESGETVNLGVPTPLGVDQLSQRDSRHFIGSTNWVGKRVPYHLTANGKVFLAWGAAASEHSNPKIWEPFARAATRPPSTSSKSA